MACVKSPEPPVGSAHERHGRPNSAGEKLGKRPRAVGGVADMGDHPVHIAGSKGEAVQGLAIWASASEISRPTLDERVRVRLQMILQFSFG